LQVIIHPYDTLIPENVNLSTDGLNEVGEIVFGTVYGHGNGIGLHPIGRIRRQEADQVGYVGKFLIEPSVFIFRQETLGMRWWTNIATEFGARS